jgi:hypothetical protein
MYKDLSLRGWIERTYGGGCRKVLLILLPKAWIVNKPDGSDSMSLAHSVFDLRHGFIQLKKQRGLL